MKRLILIDSHALIHRAYHAIPPLTSPAGEPANAVYGFASILLRILRELKPDYIAAAYDLPGPTFRHTAYERYKAQRPETPSELSCQFKKVQRLLDSFGITVFQKPGYEADDIIGTIAEKTKKNKDLEVIVVTGDMDTLQLVRPNLKVYTMKKGITQTAIYDESAVMERYGLKPRQLIDYKGLKGDSSDNIAGVKGIGEKTAAELIKNFESIEGVYKALKAEDKKISASVAEKLSVGREDAEISKELSRIKNDVPIEFSLDGVIWNDGTNKEKAAKALESFGFHSLLKRFALSDKNTLPPKPKQTSFLGELGSGESADSGEKKDSDNKPRHSLVDQKNSLSDFLLNEVEKPLRPVLREMEQRGILLDTKFLKKLSDKTNKKIKAVVGDIYGLAGEEFNINSTQELSRIIFEKLKISTAGLRKTEKSGVVSTGASELEKLKDKHPIISKVLDYRELAKLKSTYIDSLPELVNSQTGRIHTTFDQFGASTGRLSSSNPNLQNIPIMSEWGREIRKAFISADGFELVSFDYSQVELRVAAHLAEDKKMIETFLSGEDVHKMTAAEVYNISLDKVTPDLRRAAKTLNFGVLYGMGSQTFAESTGMSKTDAKKFIDEYFRDFSGIKRYIEETKKFAYAHGYVQTLFGRKRFIPEIYSQSWRFKRDAERMAVNMPVQGTAADLVKIAMVKIDKYLKKNELEDSVRMLLQVHDELVFEIRKTPFSSLRGEKSTKQSFHLKDIVFQIKKIMESVAELKVPLEVETKAGRSWGEQELVK